MAARGESLDVSLSKGGWRRPPMRGGVWLTPVLQDLKSNHCLLKGRREREKYHPPPHTHTHTHTLTNCTHQEPAIPPQPYIPDGPFSCFNQTPSRSSLSSPQLPPYLLDFQPFALCPPHIWNLLLRSLTPPDSKSTNKFSQTHLLVCTEQICPSLIPQPTSFFLLCCSLCVSSPLLLSLLSLWYRVFLYWPLKMLSSLWAILSSSQIQLLPAQWRVHRSMLIPGLSLKHQTFTSNNLQDASNFKIIELQVAELGLEISKTRIFSPL